VHSWRPCRAAPERDALGLHIIEARAPDHDFVQLPAPFGWLFIRSIRHRHLPAVSIGDEPKDGLTGFGGEVHADVYEKPTVAGVLIV